MPNTKLSALPSATPASGDLVYIVDVSDTTDSAAGSSKRTTVGEVAALATPAVGSITGLGTGVATALAVNVGSAGSPVVQNGALGTPSSGTLTNATGLPLSGLAQSSATSGQVPTWNGSAWAAATPSGGLAIGDTVTSGTAGRVLYVGAGPVLAQDAGLTYDPATDTLTSGVVIVSGLVEFSTSSVPLPSSGLGVRQYSSSTEVWANNAFAANRSGACWIVGAGMTIGWSPDTTAATQFGVTPEDTALSRAASKVIGLTDGSTAGATLSSIPLTTDQITANQNNYAPGVARYYRLSTDASRDITGLSCSQVSGQECEIWNVGSFPIVLKHQDANSTAANRFLIDTGADLTIQPNSLVALRYDSTQSRWVVASPGVVADNSITLAKMSTMATGSLIYRKTAGTGDPEVNTLATLKTDLGLSGTNTGDQDLSSYATTAAVSAGYQPLDSDLTAIAALATTAFGRSLLTQADAAATRTTIGAGTGSGDALTSGTLAQFAATTSAQLAGVISDETGSGALVFSNSPVLVTPSLGAATATTINGVSLTGTGTVATGTFTLTVSGTSSVSGTNTGDQTSISGNAGTATALQTGRTINGVSFDGTGNITVTAAADTLTGATLAANVLASSLTSVGTLTGGATGAGFTVALSTSTITGTLPAAQMPALTGDVTTSAGAVATTIANDAVSDAKLRNSAGLSVVGRSANSTGDPADIVGATVGHVLKVGTGPVLAFGYTALENGSDAGTDTTLSATSGVFTTITGWTFTAPTTGTYLVVASCLGILQTTGAQPYIIVRSKLNGTATGDNFQPLYGHNADEVYQIPASRSWVWALTAGDVITFDAAITYTGTSSYREITVPLLSYVRVA